LAQGAPLGAPFSLGAGRKDRQLASILQKQYFSTVITAIYRMNIAKVQLA
jgi:hypothetical protein